MNISPDHIERHKTINKYIKAKFSLINNQRKGNLAFVKKNCSNKIPKKEILSKQDKALTDKLITTG